MTSNQHDIAVIGASPGGYVAAIRAAQLDGGSRLAGPQERARVLPLPGW
jgi:pyruvate/2-oxoglutarate dehydrogenase complex dihydrolipoamide dehydrogenase (E3) component